MTNDNLTLKLIISRLNLNLIIYNPWIVYVCNRVIIYKSLKIDGQIDNYKWFVM